MQPIDRESNDQSKTITFVKNCVLLWGILLLIGYLISSFTQKPITTEINSFFLNIGGIIYILIFLVPIIAVITIALKFVERMLDKISKRK